MKQDRRITVRLPKNIVEKLQKMGLLSKVVRDILIQYIDTLQKK